MASNPSIDQRLTAVETAVAEIRRRLTDDLSVPDWLGRFTGAFKDEPAFAEVVEYGRALRASDRPREDGRA